MTDSFSVEKYGNMKRTFAIFSGVNCRKYYVNRYAQLNIDNNCDSDFSPPPWPVMGFIGHVVGRRIESVGCVLAPGAGRTRPVGTRSVGCV